MTTIFFVIVPPPLTAVVGFAVVGCGALVEVEVLVDVEVLVVGVSPVVGVVAGAEGGAVGAGGAVGDVAGTVGGAVVPAAVLLGGTDRDELADDEAREDAEGWEGALADEATEATEATELSPGMVMLGDPVVVGAELLEATEGSELGSATDEGVPQLLSTTARARAGTRAAGTRGHA